jgi:hypothetical protein
MRPLFGLLFILTVSIMVTGCGPKLSKRDLGHAVFEVPKVAGAEKPYEMPKLTPQSDEGRDDDGIRVVPPKK